ncbi:MAG TPA: mechanosensitive ion channel, partial [Methylophilaceae bacterium]|nr:mechanosensitive ion channel [Methylophilaceae bacterium]
MGSEIINMWTELAADLRTPAVYGQLIVLVLSLSLAWLLNRILHGQIMHKAPESWKVGIGGAKRLLFPLSSLLFVHLGMLVLRHGGNHTSMLKLASSLLVAMAVIRLTVYTLRYVFAPSNWLRTAESAIVGTVWGLVALHLVGFLPELLRALDEISFTMGKHTISLWLILQAAAIVVVTIILALSASRFLENKLMRAEQIDMNMRVVLSKLLRVVLTLVGVLTALSAVGFDITLLSVFGGALGVGLGLGLQKIASNYVSGFIILLDQSVHMGDVMTINDHYGVVYQIRSRYLVLRKLDGTEVIIPNETLIASAVINHSLSDRKARILMPVQISYDSPLELAMQAMREVALRQPRVLKDPGPEVLVKGFGESGIDLNLSIWIEDPEEGSGSLQSAIYLGIWREFQQQGVAGP